MAKNVGRVGAVSGRTQFLNWLTGLWEKRVTVTGRIADVKTSGGKFKGVTAEKVSKASKKASKASKVVKKAVKKVEVMEVAAPKKTAAKSSKKAVKKTSKAKKR